MEKFLIFDIGAGSGRAIVGSFEDSRIEFEEIHRFDNRPVFAAGELFWDILRLYSEVKIGIEICMKKHKEINSMAIDTWGCDFGLIDKNGRLICNPVHYRDLKRHERSVQMHKIITEEELFMATGGPQDRIMSIYQLFSLKSEKAVEYENAHKFLMIPDILNYLLTGEVSNEFTNATMSIMVDLNKRQWEKGVIRKLELREDLFGTISEPGFMLGMTGKSILEETGAKDLKVIISPSHDTASAVAGIPIADNFETPAFGILGTWCMSGLETQNPVINKQVFEAGFGNEGGVEGKNMLLKNITGLWVIQQCREKWMRENQKEISWKEIDAYVFASSESDSYIDVDESCFGKVQPDMSETIRDYCKKTNQSVPETIGEISRCFYESLAMKFKYNFDVLKDLTKKDIEIIHLIGGGVNNKLLCQWIANVLNVPVLAGPSETTSVGNMIFQLKADGLINNVSEGRKLCMNSFDIKSYEPKDIIYWSDKYSKYLKIARQKNT